MHNFSSLFFFCVYNENTYTRRGITEREREAKKQKNGNRKDKT